MQKAFAPQVTSLHVRIFAGAGVVCSVDGEVVVIDSFIAVRVSLIELEMDSLTFCSIEVSLASEVTSSSAASV